MVRIKIPTAVKIIKNGEKDSRGHFTVHILLSSEGHVTCFFPVAFFVGWAISK